MLRRNLLIGSAVPALVPNRTLAQAAPGSRYDSDDIRSFGARCDGRSDDSAAIRAAAAAGGVLFPPGTTVIDGNVAVGTPARASSGARVRLGPGGRLRFNAGFWAPRSPVFDVGASVSFDPAVQGVGYPEWWGARTNDGTADCTPAIAQAVEACREVSLAAADYWLGSTLEVATPHRAIRGAGKLWEGPGTATRLIVKSSTDDGLRIGLAAFPGDVNHFLQDVRMSGVAVWRDGHDPTAMAKDRPVGVRLRFCVNCYIEDVGSLEHDVGFLLTACVYTHLRDCRAFRSEMGAAPGARFTGFLFDETARIGLAAGDASVYVEHCAITTGGEPRLAESTGIESIGGFTDLFFDHVETAFLDRAMALRADPKNRDSTQDLHIANCVFDSCAKDGVLIEGDPDWADYRAAVNIIGCYIAAAGGDRFEAGLHLRNLTGAITVTNNQVLGDPATGGSGLKLERVNGLTAQGNIYSDCARPIVVEAATNCRVADTINSSRDAKGEAAIAVRDLRRSVIACMVRGQPSTFGAGVRMDGSANAFNEVQCTGVDPDCIRRGAANKLVAQGRSITTAGPFAGDNLASGVMR